MRPSIEELRRLFTYDPETGVLTRVFPHGATRVVKETLAKGISRVSVGKDFRCAKSQVCWALYYGKWPAGFLDHKDRDPLNNRIDNLREATKQQNLFNAGVRKNNLLGIRGVSFIKETGKYRAVIQKDGEIYRLGHFASVGQAKAAYAVAAKAHFGEFATVD